MSPLTLLGTNVPAVMTLLMNIQSIDTYIKPVGERTPLCRTPLLTRTIITLLHGFVPVIVMRTRITSRSATLIDHFYYYGGNNNKHNNETQEWKFVN